MRFEVLDGRCRGAAALKPPRLPHLVGVRSFSAETIAQADRLRIIGHAAGTVRRLVPPESYDQVVVLSAAPLMAKSVGEMTFGMVIAARRGLIRHHNAFVFDGTRGDPGLYASGDFIHNHGCTTPKSAS